MLQYLSIMMIVSSALLTNEGSSQNLAKRDELWHYLKENDRQVYQLITFRKFGILLQLRSEIGKKVIVTGYHFFNRIYGFN